jgi:type IV pilus assembly protein PilC
MQYTYQARNKAGQVKTGFVVAPDQAKAEQLLAENGFIITSLSERHENWFSQNNPFAPRVSYKDLVLFSRQLSTLISARVPLLQSLRILESQLENKALLAIVRDLIASVENGESFSLALSKFPETFGNIYVSLIKSGESSGSVADSLNYLADQLEKDFELRNRVRSAMTYPIFVLVALTVVGFLMFKFVLPNLTSVLEEQGGTLPPLTEAIIAATKFFQVYWWVVLLALAGLILGIRFYLRNATGRYHWDAIKIRLPLIGRIFREVYFTRFARNLSTLVAGGIPIIQALTIVSEIMGNLVYRDILLQAAADVTNGRNISDSLSAHKEFPPLVTQMVRVGEQTAQLDTILKKLAEFYEKEVDNRVNTLSTLLEPLIMIVLGIGVGILVAGILLPIYNIASTGV